MKRARQKIKNGNHHGVRLRLGSVIITGTMLFIIGSSVWQLWKLHAQVEEQISQLNQQKVTLLQQEKDLKQEITQLNTPSYIEQLAREQLGLVKRGEILISPKN